MSYVEKTLNVRITNLTMDRYIKLGYDCKIGDILEIDIEDAPNNNTVRVHLSCDICGKEKEFGCGSIHNGNKHGKYICKECTRDKLNNRECSVCGSKHGVTYYEKHGDVLCNKHKSHIRKYGKIIKVTMRDENEIFVYDDYAEFYTYDINNEVNGSFKIDLDVVPFIKEHRTYKHKDGYASYKIGKKNYRLHRYIMGLQDTSEHIVDHINGDKSDNRRCNLRITTAKINNINIKGGYSHNTSGVTGVSKIKDTSLYESYIHKNNKKVSLCHNKCFDEAVRIREIAELEYFGEYSPRYEELISKYPDEHIEIGKYI